MWADVEELTINYLLNSDIDVPVLSMIPAPEDLPQRFIRIQQVGSERRTLVHRRDMISVECWSQLGKADAKTLSETVYQILDNWEKVPDFGGWPAGPRFEADDETGTPLYEMRCIVSHRTD
ncbi:MAG: hypothetical protein FWG15_02795 [Propionibacteriaceae bacterium]|nr:hypothetical protein [Propionibacteriaceae bacterium]